MTEPNDSTQPISLHANSNSTVGGGGRNVLTEKSVITVQLGLLALMVTGVWALAVQVGNFNNRLMRVETAITSRWSFHMEREGWQQWEKLNPGGVAPNVREIRNNYGPLP